MSEWNQTLCLHSSSPKSERKIKVYNQAIAPGFQLRSYLLCGLCVLLVIYKQFLRSLYGFSPLIAFIAISNKYRKQDCTYSIRLHTVYKEPTISQSPAQFALQKGHVSGDDIQWRAGYSSASTCLCSLAQLSTTHCIFECQSSAEARSASGIKNNHPEKGVKRHGETRPLHLLSIEVYRINHALHAIW